MKKLIYAHAALLGSALLLESLSAASGTFNGQMAATPIQDRYKCATEIYGSMIRWGTDPTCGNTLVTELGLPLDDSFDVHSVEVKVWGSSAAGSQDIYAQYYTIDHDQNNVHLTSQDYPPSATASFQTIGWTSFTPNDYHVVVVWITANAQFNYVRWWNSEI